MKLMDCVEVIVEKNKYAKEGVHKGMQGVIWEPESKDGAWVVLFPQYGEKEDIADLTSARKTCVYFPMVWMQELTSKSKHSSIIPVKQQSVLAKSRTILADT